MNTLRPARRLLGQYGLTNQGLTYQTSEGYYAYGPRAFRARTGNIPLTDHKFTGQKRDGTGLMYFNARYYDPELGQFLSPDTLVPDPGNLFDYNRYLYTRGNPMRYTDPTGHCINSTTKNASDSQDYDNAECWRLANTIANMWDDTDYWKNRFTSKDIFLNQVANNAYNGTDFFQSQFSLFLNDDAGKQWLGNGITQNKAPVVTVDPVDAVGVGISYNGDIPFLGAAGLAGGVGVEILAHKNGQVAVYLFGGGGASVGAGANSSLYVVRVRNLPGTNDYQGPSISSDVTASLVMGLTAGTFEGPNGGAYGEKYGFAPGANLSASVVQSVYSPPLIIFDPQSR